jgi:hypothetical protein
MSFQDPPRHQRQARYPAIQQHEGGHSSYRQHPPWDDDPPWQNAWDTGARQDPRETTAQPSIWDTSSQRTLRNSGAQRTLGNTGAQPTLLDSGAQRSLWDTGAQRSLWDTGAQRSARNTGGHRLRRNEASNDARRPDRGLLPGAIAGFLAAAVAIGIANLVAAFVRPQASPIIAVGGAFIDRTPSALKNFAVEKFGENDKNMLLLGMYVTIALIAIVIGILAWRRVAIGVAGIGLFGLFGAFVAVTRPESHVTDIIPSIVGGIAGIATIIWLVQAGMPRSRQAWARGR